MFGQNRQQIRQFYHDVWNKMQHNQDLSGLERMVAEVISQHPEYRAMFQATHQIDQEYFVEAGQTNPYLHMGLHLSLHEQISTDRPSGIRLIYQQLLAKTDSAHDCDHLMMETLAESLWQAQRDNQPPSEQNYLESLQKLLDKKSPDK